MDPFTLGFWLVSLILFALAWFRRREDTVRAMKKSKAMMGNMLGEIVAVILLIGLVLSFIPPETIRTLLGSDHTAISTVVAAIVGSITLIPAFVAFPLVGSLVNAGASIVPAAAFLTTLTMVGIATFPLEKRAFGTRFALTRNAVSFTAAIVIAIFMGVIL
ncbi:MAG: hypothetical protein PWQ12_1758 [Clostridiales bacterium]|jgi:uncharacterized membrane protein YraQ (UPF0718 family)|nr:hypothetical protein [Clostridiales bacterium]